MGRNQDPLMNYYLHRITIQQTLLLPLKAKQTGADFSPIGCTPTGSYR